MISMRQVAKKAGVHVSTVSRALSGKVPVDPETAARIKGVVEKLRYEPNFLAKNLALGQSQILGVITHRAIEGNFFWEIFGGIEAAAAERRYHPLVLTSRDAEEAGAMIRQKRMDGLVALVSGGEDFDEVLPSGDELPLVVVNKDLPGKLCVRSDYFSGVRELIRSAAPGKNRRAFFIGADAKNTTYAELERGFESAVSELKIPKTVLGNQDADLEKAAQKAVGSDLLFFAEPRGLLRFYRLIRKKRPDLIREALWLCLDEVPGMSFLEMPIQVLRQDLDSVGREAASLLLDLCSGKIKTGERKTILIPPILRTVGENEK